jgi:hypothetical protein
MACVKQSKTLSRKAKLIAFLFKATKTSETREVFDWLLATFGIFSLGFYTNSTQLAPILVQLLPSLCLQGLYLASFISNSTCTLSWLDPFLNSVFI